MKKTRGGYQATHLSLLNGRLFHQLISREAEALYSGEQGKILYSFWLNDGIRTATDIAIDTGLANNTLTSMLKRLEEQGLIVSKLCPNDKRKKHWHLTEKGWEQEAVGNRVGKYLADIFYDGFSTEEMEAFEAYQERILSNLRRGLLNKHLDDKETAHVD
ncbi:MarR family winged helix-turn-helix transcriptional regulator [Streptococcus respiraculi]|uniref:MarR family winged helix-turn-helix transcriptional regulator n=1 Tax=Streptococcus respiraculi TaxID=2021971 RepID=UPI000E70DA23|nr:MarR family transcriptional regulator [Streptococcus respiraculi]